MSAAGPAPRAAARRPRLLEGYAPRPGASDELIGPDGAPRPVWRPFLEHFDRLSPEEVARRQARGDQQLRDAGVYFRHYEGAGSVERGWPFSHLPVLMPESEWRALSAGLVQRAELLEALAADLYGPNRMVAEGWLPASLVAQSRGWLRPLVGVRPRSGRFLHILAFELGRGPEGDWWVLGDRADAPSGAGFALENRLASSQVFPEFFAESGVLRLSSFFRAFREALQGLGSDAGRVAILTPGLLNDSYFEHAYIARYLGFTLIEGEDLLVEQGRVMMRTVEGPRPVSVIWRRIDSAFADPLELDERSRLGAPGLVSAARAGGVTMANALGAGVLEMRALLAFLPRLCERLRGERLALPNIATWWCGQPAEREHVRAEAARMMIGSAFATRLPFESGEATLLGGALRPAAREGLDRLLAEEADRLVGQEAVKLSTTPVLAGGRLAPRPMTLRLYLARTPAGWEVMPGGYARIGRSEDASALTLQAGGSVADVWIVPDGLDGPPAPPAPSLAARGARPTVTALPSRAADNLYWMGRYVERAEDMMRLLRAWHVRRAENVGPALLALMAERLEEIGLDPERPLPEGLRQALGAAIACAGRVRDRFSVDGWSALHELDETAREMSERLGPGDDVARAMSVLLRTNAAFSGLVHENMYRTAGWRFLSLGRAIERASNTAASLALFADSEAPEGALDLAVELGDSVMTHRRRYAFSIARETVLDLLALDAQNPRSVIYGLAEIRERVEALPEARTDGRLSGLARAALGGYSALATLTPETVDGAALRRVEESLSELSDRLTALYLGAGRVHDL